MTTNYVIAFVSKVRTAATIFLEKELFAHGIEGLSPSYGALLSSLYRNNGKLRMKEVADLINRDKSTVTHLVNKLTKMGIVIREKSHEDSRESYVVLTPKAWAMEETLRNISQDLITTAYKGFTEDEKVQLVKLLHKMENNFKN
jgi:MarR family transcriptional regulator, organic hydroperoxide resistance regulator